MPDVSRPLLSVVAPCFDEELVIERFYHALKGVLQDLDGLDHEIVLVDDGSDDATLAILNRLARGDPRLVPLSLSRNFGQQAALSAGLDAARGDAVVLMDSDLQHPPELIATMVARWREGWDVVSALRRSTDDVSWLKRWSSRAFYWLLARMSATPMEPGAVEFLLLSRRVRDVLVGLPERHRFLRGLVSWIGFRRTYVPFDAPPRAAGRTKYTLRRMVFMALDAVFSFSVAPIRLVMRAGVGIALAGLAYLAYLLGHWALHGDEVPGWGGALGILLFLGGLQFVIVGVVGEYLARVFEQVKGRPVYVLKQGRGEAPLEPTPVVRPTTSEPARP